MVGDLGIEPSVRLAQNQTEGPASIPGKVETTPGVEPGQRGLQPRRLTVARGHQVVDPLGLEPRHRLGQNQVPYQFGQGSSVVESPGVEPGVHSDISRAA